jgi:hypothetical protein
LKRIHELRHDPKNAPRIFVNEIIGIAHAHGMELKIKNEKLKAK